MNIIQFKATLSFINGFDIKQFISESEKIYSQIGIELIDCIYKKDAIDLLDDINLSEKTKLSIPNRNNFIFDEIIFKVDMTNISKEYLLFEPLSPIYTLAYAPMYSLNNKFLNLRSIS